MTFLQRIATIAITALISGTTIITVSTFLWGKAVSDLSQFQTVSTHSFYDLSFPFKHTFTDIRMDNEVKNSNTVKYIGKILQTASSGDRITFHLAGYGGEVDSVLYIINNIRKTKAFVLMSVEAPVYSGHAYLALSGHALAISPYAFLMLHTSTIVEMDCAKETGMDRGHPAKDKCEQLKAANIDVIDAVIINLPVLTIQEKATLIEGNDVYLMPKDVIERSTNPVIVN